MPDVSPLEWVHRLSGRLEQQRKHATFYDKYYAGERELEIVRREYDEIFGRNELDPPRTNVSAVGVDAAAERLQVEGFRVIDEPDDGRGGGAGEDEGDEDAPRRVEGQSEPERLASDIWHRNDLDVMEQIANVEALAKGNVFGLLWPDRAGRAQISIEDPEQMVVARRQEPPYDVIAALKLWEDEWDGRELATLYLLEGIYRFQAKRTTSSGLWTPGASPSERWEEREPAFTPAPQPWRGRRLPVFELANRARLLKPPQSDLVNVAPLADTHAKIIADLVIAASFGAVPIRTATGIRLERDRDGNLIRDRDGNIRAPFSVRADRSMVSEREQAKFGTLPAADLAGYVAALDMILREIRVVTRVPLHYYGEGGSAGQSGETLKAAEGSLVRRVNAIEPRFGLTWRQMMSMALALELPGNHLDIPVKVRWADTETRVEASMIDGATKLEAVGVPLEIILLEHMKYPPELVQRAMKLRRQEQQAGEDLLAALRTDAIDPAAGGQQDDVSVPTAAVA